MPKGECTETFLTAFLSCWLCLFILPVRDAGCIHSRTFLVASSMERGQAYCLCSAIFAIIYRGLGEICRSTHPGRKRAKYFRTYDFDDNVSSNLRMPKFSGFGRAKSFDLNGARELISSSRGFYWNSAIRHRIKAQIEGRLLPKAFKNSYSRNRTQHSLDKDFRATISVTSISAIPIQHVAMPAKPPDEVRLTPGPLPATTCRRKLKSIIVCTLDEQGMSNVQGRKLNYGKTIFPPPDNAENIMDFLDCNASLIECIDFLRNDLCLNDSNSICAPNGDDEAKSTPKVDALRVLPLLCPSRASQDVSVLKVDAVIREVNKNGARMTCQVILDKVFCTSLERLHYLKGQFNSLYDLIKERGGDAIPLMNKVERVVHQACDLKDLQKSYFD
ncbi:LOW QUALITY PROTEIN: hypothetical protein Cgig2_030146 [Carnegiea gigantea]|uniref:Uncharacterized protein n=1 Tax=Carnegiea gigantea TaxID=171969 RepID=A0A9Q1K146_9CARY|nr:LOW QUALITY PROTEIN: hypothetical protein Cgig2_030146 [Carnegiea gigantea]